MIKISNGVDEIPTSAKIFITNQLGDGGIVPINISGRLTNELGKELLKAASDGDVDETQRLLYEGAPFTADWLGTSPLHLAAQGNHVEICEILLRAGISTNARTKVDRTPLHMAAYEGHLEVVKLLLKEEADVDETDLLGMTPLHWAVQNGHFDVVQALLNGGAHQDMENKFGLKPIDIAHQIERYDIIELLEEGVLEDPTSATENLAIEMATEDENVEQLTLSNNTITMEDIDDSSNALDDKIHEMKFKCEPEMDNSLSDSMKILQEHGITLLPTDDDNNILSTVMESGHSVVLTEVGKQILESVKAEEESSQNITRNLVNLERERFITVSPSDLLTLSPQPTVEKKERSKVINKESRNIKRIVMKKNKLQPMSLTPNILKQANQNVQLFRPSSKETENERLSKELAEAKRTIEEYKQKLLEKEAELETYKLKLKLLGYS
ncbi:GA-binding protein subunit beta-1-like isoform X2 [Coccinella septempunctata]|nr:GA-binding protein subunit beta-1-like isoform X2 [Coccinella septempunctata]